MSKCKTYRCKASCCYNIALPIGFLERHADKVVNKPISIATLPISDNIMEQSELVFTDFDPNLNKCPFLRMDCKCNVYGDRPEICRRYGDGSEPLLTCEFLK